MRRDHDFVTSLGDDLVRTRKLLGPVPGRVPRSILENPVRRSTDYEKYLRHTNDLLSSPSFRRLAQEIVEAQAGIARNCVMRRRRGGWMFVDIDARMSLVPLTLIAATFGAPPPKSCAVDQPLSAPRNSHTFRTARATSAMSASVPSSTG